MRLVLIMEVVAVMKVDEELIVLLQNVNEQYLVTEYLKGIQILPNLHLDLMSQVCRVVIVLGLATIDIIKMEVLVQLVQHENIRLLEPVLVLHVQHESIHPLELALVLYVQNERIHPLELVLVHLVLLELLVQRDQQAVLLVNLLDEVLVLLKVIGERLVDYLVTL